MDYRPRAMSTRIGINGFRRMGRLALRAAWDWPELDFVQVNELHGDAATAAHLLTFDSVHGRWPHDVRGDGDGETLTIDGTPLTYSAHAEPGAVDWDVDVVLAGIGIERGSTTTLHDVTNTQTIVDAPHRDLRRARAASMSLIPTTTGSTTAIGLIFPELEGKLDGLAVRVPLLNASLTDAVFEVARPTTVEEVNGLLRAAADGPLAGILGYEERPLVSIDYKDDPRSGVVDALSTMVTDGTQVKVLAWYDNEWAYANRLAELARTVALAL
ncbi:MAG: NAD-dependent glyceraldehyde-3-phosphate dehydrogenase for arsenate detoxification [uncultured Solirubrobacteraceae bacterium]|uniref:NAD-dependent glyceraldehyde-3-phosphate dehydrogenase for arsenate detoxification n=1 Tax=uncultured Solirubrobacteraceae bacterium TaxID=1162706 RepID=A0A6J4TZP1_9ACTN|nr:MAG: NAD-dependent glyceraldehyde-3-phosphate dehydrogenase for arsenate detoxification [uncultured Solirubrobacteraceae bacterium]